MPSNPLTLTDLFAFFTGLIQNYERLRRQHKAKGRGKNWRAVR